METNDQQNVKPEIDSVADYHAGVQQLELEGYESNVRKARNALYVTAVLVFLGEMIVMFQTYRAFDIYIFVIALVEAAIFVALALWTKKKPYTAVVSGLIAFIAIIILATAVSTYEDGAAGFIKGLFGGIIVKVIILVNLIRALKDSKSLQEAQEEQKRNA